MNRPFSLAHLTMLSVPPPQLVETAARAGYQFVSLRPIPVGAPERAALPARHRSRAARAHQGGAWRPPAWACSTSKWPASSRKRSRATIYRRSRPPPSSAGATCSAAPGATTGRTSSNSFPSSAISPSRSASRSISSS